MLFAIRRLDVHWYVLRIAEAIQMLELIFHYFWEDAGVFQGQLSSGWVVVVELLVGGKLGGIGDLRVRYLGQYSCFELSWTRGGGIAGFQYLDRRWQSRRVLLLEFFGCYSTFHHGLHPASFF